MPRKPILILLIAVTLAAHAKKHDKGASAIPEPVKRIALDFLGLPGTPTPGLLRSQAAIATLDFVDNDHVLLTFLAKPLLNRNGEDSDAVSVPNSATRQRQDRVAHAEIVTIATGEITIQRDWRLFDREPYLLPLGQGSFLLREGGRLSMLDASLDKRRIAESREAIVYAQTELGSNLMLIEKEHERHTAEEHAKAQHDALLHDTPIPPEQADVYGWKLPLTLPPPPAVFHALLPRAGVLTGNDEGLIEVSPARGGKYELFFTSYSSDARKLVLKTNSECRPATHMLRHDVILVTTCKGNSNQETAVTLDGDVMWKHPSTTGLLADYSLAENGKRYAVQSVGVAAANPLSSATDDDFAQGLVQVYDTDTGARLFATVMQPLYGAFRTAALSADGMRLAVLRKGALEVYNLPPLQEADAPAEAQPRAGR